MFGTIRKHQNWLWAVIITVVIISFVVFFSPNDPFGGSSGGGASGGWHEENIPGDRYNAAQREAIIGLLLNQFTRRLEDLPGVDIDGDGTNDLSRVDFETRSRLRVLDQINGQKIAVDDATVIRRIKTMPQFGSRTGEYAPEAYNAFVQNLGRYRLSEDDFHRYVQNDLATMHLAELNGLAGRLSPARLAEPVFRRQHEQILTEAFFFPATNFTASVTNFAPLPQFYTNQGALYREPEKRRLAHLVFANSNFLAAADLRLTNLTSQVDDIFKRVNPSQFKDANGTAMSTNAIKLLIREDFRKAQAFELARASANGYAEKLFAQEPLRATNLWKTAATTTNAPAVEVVTLAEHEIAVRFQIAADKAARAFRLTESEPLTEPLPGSDGIHFFAMLGTEPSYLPAFEKLTSKTGDEVKKHFAETQSRDLARISGRVVHAALTNAFAQGKDFAAATAAAKVKFEALPAFSADTDTLPALAGRVDLTELLSAAASLTPGKTGPFIEGQNGGFILHLKSRSPVAAEKLKDELPKFIDTYRRFAERAATREWFRKQEEDLVKQLRAELSAAKAAGKVRAPASSE